MAEKKNSNQHIKSLKELSILPEYITLGGKDTQGILKDFLENKTDELAKTLDIIKKIKSATIDVKELEKDITNIIKEANKAFTKGAPAYEKTLDLIKRKFVEIGNIQKETNIYLRAAKAVWSDTSRILDRVVQQNKEIYEISHNMQTESNVTWRQFTELYKGAYQAARQMNSEIGKQLVTAKDLVSVQDKLLSAGWKNIDSASLTNVAGSMSLLQRTLGGLDDRLIHAFETSFRQFGSQTDQFVTSMGNRLNAFSNTFGMTVGALSGAVAEVMNVNTFISRNNMKAQIQANETFMQAAALSSQVGITSFSYLSNLTRTSQFGTADDLVNIYQSGAYLQGFDTFDFIDKMSSGKSGDSYEANKNLISSIYNTLTGIGDNKLLRNQYMQGIQSGFGLSQDDIIAILNNGANLDTYDKELQEKLLDIDNSMLDELKGLKITLVDQFKNLVANNSEKLGAFMNEHGLYNLTDPVRNIQMLLMAQLVKDPLGKVANKLFSGLGGASSASGAGGATNILGTAVTSGGLSKVAKVGLGTSIAAGSNLIGYNLIANNTSNNEGIEGLGHGLNILGGAGGGALAGAAFGPYGVAIGAALGAIGGVISSIAAEKTKQNAMAELEDAKRVKNRSEQTQASTGDPLADILINGFNKVTDAITGEAELDRQLQFTLDLAQKGSAFNK